MEPFTRLEDYKKGTDLFFPSAYLGLARAVVDLLEEENYNSYINTIVLTGTALPTQAGTCCSTTCRAASRSSSPGSSKTAASAPSTS